jgi:hypothetical protein
MCKEDLSLPHLPTALSFSSFPLHIFFYPSLLSFISILWTLPSLPYALTSFRRASLLLGFPSVSFWLSAAMTTQQIRLAELVESIQRRRLRDSNREWTMLICS